MLVIVSVIDIHLALCKADPLDEQEDGREKGENRGTVDRALVSFD